MIRIRNHIASRGARFAEKPMFAYLRDPMIEPEKRLAFVPALSHFVMSFADLYRFFLTEKSPQNRFQEIVNAHLSEDSFHWKWFLADLGALDLDPAIRFSAALRFIWGDATARTRALTYGICKLTGAMTDLEKLVLVQCIEATGAIALGAVAEAGRDLERKSGRRLTYFGAHHVESESEHTLEQDDVRSALDEVEVSETERARCFAIVDEAFGYFDGFIDDMFNLAKVAAESGSPLLVV
jgi:hypothetical protein